MTATLPTTAVPELFHVCMPALPQTTSHGLLYDHEKDDYENKEHILHRTSCAAILRRGSDQNRARWCATRNAAVVQTTSAENAPVTQRASRARVICLAM
jgi:4'-phosphopantetheinyl transferase EntD